jgi:hypothetical protein
MSLVDQSVIRQFLLVEEIYYYRSPFDQVAPSGVERD